MALSFAISTLYLLVQPRPKEVAPPSQVQMAQQRGSKPIQRSYDDNYNVLMFAYVGWDVYPHLPSNSYFRFYCVHVLGPNGGSTLIPKLD